MGTSVPWDTLTGAVALQGRDGGLLVNSPKLGTSKEHVKEDTCKHPARPHVGTMCTFYTEHGSSTSLPPTHQLA